MSDWTVEEVRKWLEALQISETVPNVAMKGSLFVLVTKAALTTELGAVFGEAVFQAKARGSWFAYLLLLGLS